MLLASRLKCINPKCKSSDAGHIYQKENGSEWFHCFSCGFNKLMKRGSMENQKLTAKPISQEVLDNFLNSITPDNPKEFRGIHRDTFKKYSVVVDDKFFYFPFVQGDGEIVGLKLRNKNIKRFFYEGTPKAAGLFGQQAFTKGGKAVTICEGEFDAMAAYQMLGSKYPVVSVKTGAEGALSDCKDSFEWLDSFEKIVISFDNDEAGQRAAKKVAELFGSKAKILKTSDSFKDANEYLLHNASGIYGSDWWKAETFVPDGIVAGNTLWELVSKATAEADCFYPFSGINELTYGIRKGELVTLSAGSGLGKSQVVKETAFHILNNTKSNIGLLLLEESITKTAKSLMGLAANKPLHLPNVVVTEEEKREAFDATLGTGRIFLFDHFGSTSVDNIVNRVRYMAKALDCEYIFLDHVSIIVSAQESGDERKALDEIMTKLRMLVQETNIALFIVSHLKRPDGKGHEEGAVTSLSQLRGSGSIAQLSDIVIGLERNAQAEDEEERNTTYIRVLKNRFSGLTGPACSCYYDRSTGRMVETTQQEITL